MLQNATTLRKSAPGPPNSSDEHVSCTAPATENAPLQILFKCPTPAIVFGNATKPKVLLTYDRCTIPCAYHAERHLNDIRACGVFNILSSKRASRHHGVHFFDISTAKSGPSMVCFAHFNFEMFFLPQRRTLFRHLNFQKCSGPGVFCTSSLLFDPPEPQIIGKTLSRLSCLFKHLDLLSSQTFSF